jgi:hypothetical protein
MGMSGALIRFRSSFCENEPMQAQGYWNNDRSAFVSHAVIFPDRN